MTGKDKEVTLDTIHASVLKIDSHFERFLNLVERNEMFNIEIDSKAKEIKI